jgi:hypothetical protein
MTGGARMSARASERERARARVGRDAGPCRRKRAGMMRTGRLAGPNRRKEGKAARVEFCFLFIKCE